MVFVAGFFDMTGSTKRLEIGPLGELIGPSTAGDDVIDFEPSSAATLATPVPVTIEDLLTNLTPLDAFESATFHIDSLEW